MSIPAHVVERFARKNNVLIEDSVALFSELEEFLDRARTGGLTPSNRLDEAWHEFILDTKSYADYCNSRFGRFIHHIPTAQRCNCGSGSGMGACKTSVGSTV